MANHAKYQGAHRADRSRWAPLVRGGTVRRARGAECCYAEKVGGVVVGGLIFEGESWIWGIPIVGGLVGLSIPAAIVAPLTARNAGVGR